MTNKPREIQEGKFSHIYSRGVNKDNIFRDSSDYLKFMGLLSRFNCKEKQSELKRKQPTKIVEIFCYTLMPNHFHFILKELTQGGISKFLQKVLGQYARYYNDKYGRVGTLFGQRFKDKLVDSDQYFEHLVGYIWNNPVKLIRPDYNSAELFKRNIKLSKKEKSFAFKYPYKYFPENYLGPQHKKENNIKFDNFDF